MNETEPMWCSKQEGTVFKDKMQCKVYLLSLDVCVGLMGALGWTSAMLSPAHHDALGGLLDTNT